MDRNSNNNNDDDNSHHHHHRGTRNSRRGRGRYSRRGGRGGGSDWGGPTQSDGLHWSNRSNGQMSQDGGSSDRPQQQQTGGHGQGGGSCRPKRQQTGGQTGQVGGSYRPPQQHSGGQMGQGGGSYRPQQQQRTGGQMGQVGGWYRPQQQSGGQMGRGVGPMNLEAVEVDGSGGFGRGGMWRSGRPGFHTQATTQPQPRALPEKGNECFENHLIEQDGTLNGVEFDKFLEKVNLAACGLDYVVVSIMGPQSSGKSTLLNHLFGTKFKEMDGLNERSKTTQGIWLARCPGIEPFTLVMDVEGSDGGERGEDDTAFEKRGGLFALAVSHIVLINMFQTCIGLENGASMPLWKNVLEGTLRLFSPQKKTLMFVIRDLVRTPLEVLENRLRKDIQKIWDSIPKPEGHKKTPLSTFFNVEVVGLPNYLEREEHFKEQVYNLRQRFIHLIAPGGLAGDRWDTIRGADFSLSAQEIWKTIKEDRMLDLPKHMVMVATVRCGEIVDKKFNAFVANEERRQLEEGARTNRMPNFGKKYSSIIKSCLHNYDLETAYFDKGVRSEKRNHLEEKLMLHVRSTFQSILANIGSRTLAEFEEALSLRKGKDVTVAANECKQACMKSFDNRCADIIVEQANCNTSVEREKLEREIALHTLKVYLDKKPSVTTPEWEDGLKKFLGGCLVGGLLGSLGMAGAAGALFCRPDLTKAALDHLVRALVAANQTGLTQAVLTGIMRSFKFAFK